MVFKELCKLVDFKGVLRGLCKPYFTCHNALIYRYIFELKNTKICKIDGGVTRCLVCFFELLLLDFMRVYPLRFSNIPVLCLMCWIILIGVILIKNIENFVRKPGM